MNKLKTIIDIFISGEPIPKHYKDHLLKGEYQGFRDLHIEPDWLLVYYIKEGTVYLSAIGSHAYIYKM